MPTYCKCSLTVTGDEETMRQFYEAFSDTNWYGHATQFSFKWHVNHTFFTSTDSKGDYEDHQELWRTGEINPDNIEMVDRSSTTFVCIFSSSWNPPYGWVKRCQRRYPKLDFYLGYIGESFFGWYNIIDGEYRHKELKLTDYIYLVPFRNEGDEENPERVYFREGDDYDDFDHEEPRGKLLDHIKKFHMEVFYKGEMPREKPY